jgi:uncharacterized protein
MAANHVSPERRREIARLGGLKVSQNRDHMKQIGIKGGKTISANRAFMAEIGLKGALAKKAKNQTN